MTRHRPTFYEGKLGQYFRDLRETHGWSLGRAVSIARQRKLQVGLSALKWLEGGLTKNPEPELLRTLSALYGEPYRNIVQEVTKHAFDIKPEPRLHTDALAASAKSFISLPLLATPIAARKPLVLTPDPDHNERLAFQSDFVKKFTRPVCLRVGRHEDAMAPTIQSGDVVLIDQNITRRRKPRSGHLYAVSYGPLTDKDGGALHRVELSGRTLVLNSDHPDKSAYPTRTFDITAAMLPDILLGEVVWISRTLPRGNFP